jgi:hypothetical protein
MDAYEIRRHPDGALDVDFYRRRAARLRAQARDDAVAKIVQLARAVIAAVILVAALCLMPAADGTGWNGARTNPHATAGQPLAAIDSGQS